MNAVHPQEYKKSGFSIYRPLDGDALRKAIGHLEQLQAQFPGLEVRLSQNSRRKPAVQLISSQEIRRIPALRQLEPVIALRGIFRANPELFATRPIRFDTTTSIRNRGEHYFVLVPTEEDTAILELQRLAVYKTLAGMVKVDFDIPTHTLDATLAYSGHRMPPTGVKEVLDAVREDLPLDCDLLAAKSGSQPFKT